MVRLNDGDLLFKSLRNLVNNLQVEVKQLRQENNVLLLEISTLEWEKQKLEDTLEQIKEERKGD